MYILKDMSYLAKLVSKYFNVKFEPDLVYITNLINLQNRTEFTDFTQVKSDFTDSRF